MAKTAIITGCNRGIGLGIAQELIRNDFDVFGLNKRSMLTLMDNLKTSSCDVGRYQAVERSISRFKAIYENLDVVVVNAGIRRFGKIADLSVEDWDRSVAVNLNSVFYLAKLTLPMLRKSRGHFIVIGSHAGKYHFESGAAYCASKMAPEAIINCIIEEERQHGVKATYCSIGAVENRFHGDPNHGKLLPHEVGQAIVSLVNMPGNMINSYIDIRPVNPKKSSAGGIGALQEK